jgi:hypothetical protein
VVECLVGPADKRPQFTLHLRTLNFAFFQIMFLRTMLFGSLKNFLFCVTRHRARAVESYLTAFQFVHVRETATLLQRLSYKSSEIILYERFRRLVCEFQKVY